MIAENYYLDNIDMLKKLKKLYIDEIPTTICYNYLNRLKVKFAITLLTTEEVEEALAIIRLTNFDGDKQF